MSIKYNKGFRKKLTAITESLSNIGSSFMSLLYMVVLSSNKVARQGRKEMCGEKSRGCCVLGNGPSLKSALDHGEVRIEGNDVVCVNLFCLSEYFDVIKPQYYFLADVGFFAPRNERHEKMVDKLIGGLNKVSWPMTLIIPSVIPVGARLLSSLKNNHIRIIKINTTRIDGFRGFCHHYYNRQMAVPQCENILGVVLTKVVSWNYKNIYLYGADHSWTKDLFVDDDNVVCYGDRHVYDTNLSIVKMNHPLWVELRSFTIVFKAHMKIQEYAKTKGCNIYNCTKGSFIDAYPREQTIHEIITK